MQIRRLSYALGAEISGVDIRNPLDDKTFKEIHAAFLKYSVLLFRGTPLTREQHIAFSRMFGEIRKLPEVQHKHNDPKYPELLLLTNQFNARSPGYTANEIWHTDKSSTLVPPMASLLRCVEIPHVGGDTMFTNCYLAYETLTDAMKRMLDGLHGIHVGGGNVIDDSSPERLAESMRANQAAQPIVRVHPETGRKALFFGEKVRQLEAFTTEESKPLIDFLCQRATRAQFVYRHVWQEDDLLIWDNRCTMHIAVNDYDNSKTRRMERVTIKGTPCGHAYDGPLDYAVPGSELKARFAKQRAAS